MNTKKLLAGICMIGWLLLSACGNEDGGQQEAEDQETPLETVTLVLDWTPNTNHTGFYVAQENGYYEELGIDLEIIQPPEDGATLMVASGQAEFGIDFQDSLAPAFTGDDPLPVTSIAAIIQHNTSGILSLAENGITSPALLEGHNYATWGLPVEQAMVRHIMEEDGGDFSQLELIPNTVTDVIAALQTDIDSVWVFYGWDGIATEVNGLDTNFLAFSDIEPAFDYYSPVIITNNELMETDPELISDFLAATRKGYEKAIEDPEAAAGILLEAVPELDQEITLASQQYLAEEYQAEEPVWGRIEAQRWNAFYQWLYENELIEDEIPHDFGFTNAFLEDD